MSARCRHFKEGVSCYQTYFLYREIHGMFKKSNRPYYCIRLIKFDSPVFALRSGHDQYPLPELKG